MPTSRERGKELDRMLCLEEEKEEEEGLRSNGEGKGKGKGMEQGGREREEEGKRGKREQFDATGTSWCRELQQLP